MSSQILHKGKEFHITLQGIVLIAKYKKAEPVNFISFQNIQDR